VKVFDNSGKLLKTFFEGSIKTYATNFAANEDSLKISYDAGVEIINTATGAKKQLPCTEAGDFNEEGIFIGKQKLYDFYDYTGKKLNTKSYYSVVNFSEGICAMRIRFDYSVRVLSYFFSTICRRGCCYRGLHR